MSAPPLALGKPQPATDPGTAAETVVPLTAVHPIARVDLMPAEVYRNRAFRRARTVMVAALGASLVVAVAGYVTATAQAAAAADDLAVEQARTAVLQTETAQYAAVPALDSSLGAARQALVQATGTEIAWYPVLADITLTAPDTVSFEQITLSAEDPTAVSTNPIAAVGSVATITMSGRAVTHADVAAWVAAMGGISTWADQVYTESTLSDEDGLVDFTATASLSADTYSGRFDALAGLP